MFTTDKNQIIALLLIAMAIVLTIELMYIMLKKKRRKEETEMFRKPSQPVETMADKAHNTVLTTENISTSLEMRGINTTEADAIIRQAKKDMAVKDYASAIERAEAAKIVLLRLKRGKDARTGPVQPHPDPEMRPMDRSVYDSEKAAREEKSLDSLPANYMQSKFMLATTKDLLEKKDVTHGEAYEFYKDAVSSFEREDYTRALSQSIKAEKLLDSETLTLIAEEKHAPSDQEVGVPVCPECDVEVSEDDVFCRKCGENLEVSRECPECGTGFEPIDMFCRKCGNKLSEAPHR